MALQVWLPFTQDLRNLGLNSVSVTNHNTTIINGGKLGKACNFNGSSTYLEFSSAISFSNNFSICCWLDLTNINSTLYFVGFADLGGIRYGTDNTFLYFNNGQTLTYSFTKVNRFVHVAFTCASNSVKLYVDGTLIGSALTLSSALKNCTIIGKRSDGYNYNGKINDFRIYDHCLTPEEVKEISKGLVCHYTLSDLSIVNKNLLGTDSLLTDTAVNVGKNYSQFKSSSDFFGLQAGDTFTVSCYLTCPSVKGGSLCILYYTDGDNRVNVYGTSISAGQSGLVTYTGTLTSALRAYTTMLICILNSNTSIESTDTFYVKNLKIEKFNGNTAYTTSDTSIIYDSSGYCNNGTISGNPSLDSNTPRYNKALLFPANSASTITTPLSIDNSAWTIAFWEKCDWTNTETSNPYILYWNNYIRIIKYSTTARMRALFYYKDSEGTQTNALPYFMDSVGTDTSWKHFVVVFDGSAIKVYLNGVYIRLVALSSGFLLYGITGNLVLNYTTETIAKSLSDVRVYATALSADDVTALYNLGLV